MVYPTVGGSQGLHIQKVKMRKVHALSARAATGLTDSLFKLRTVLFHYLHLSIANPSFHRGLLLLLHLLLLLLL